MPSRGSLGCSYPTARSGTPSPSKSSDAAERAGVPSWSMSAASAASPASSGSAGTNVASSSNPSSSESEAFPFFPDWSAGAPARQAGRGMTQSQRGSPITVRNASPAMFVSAGWKASGPEAKKSDAVSPAT